MANLNGLIFWLRKTRKSVVRRASNKGENITFYKLNVSGENI